MIPTPPGDGRHPTVSVVSVNYNGRRYLRRFLESMQALDYPPACYRVVVVDNASTDGSVELLREQFPQVCLLEAGGNLGFAGGCNLGIRSSRSDYVVLANNDTVVEPGWLRALVEVAESDPRVGLVGSKILFLTPFLDLGLETREAGAGSSEAGAPVLLLHDARVDGCDYDKLVVRAGRLATVGEAGGIVHALAGSARLAVPVTGTDGPVTLALTLRAASPRGEVSVAVLLGDAEIGRVVATDTRRTFRFELPREVVARAAHDLINNVGTRVDGEGRFGDRGIYEFDHGQYDEVTDVPALCGASVLLRRSMLERIGGFDTRYFMYFEDVDLSWRAGRAGWRRVYTPHSRLRHVHAGSSVEGSSLWAFYVGRNHLFWLIKNGTVRAAVRAVGKRYVRAVSPAIHAVGRALRGRRAATPATMGDVELQIARSLTRRLPGLIASRYRAPEADGTGRWTTVRDAGPASA